MPAKSTPRTPEEILMHELRFGRLDQDKLKELVAIVAGIQKAGLKRMKAFPKGQPPIPDGIRVSGVVETPELSKVLTDILTHTPNLGTVILFPYGIPWPEIYRVTIDIGNPVEGGPVGGF